MEAFMRWHLIYRESAEMSALMAEIDPAMILSQNVKWDTQQCMLFLEVERA
jgi:hypothetical protein